MGNVEQIHDGEPTMFVRIRVCVPVSLLRLLTLSASYFSYTCQGAASTLGDQVHRFRGSPAISMADEPALTVIKTKVRKTKTTVVLE